MGDNAHPNKFWNQVHGNSANTGFATLGPANLRADIVPIGDPGTSTPVEGPDGSIFVSVLGDSTQEARIVQVGPGQPHSTRVFWQNSGQISTPAVDSLGNLYVTVNKLADRPGPPGEPQAVELVSRVVKLMPFGAQVVEAWSENIYLPRGRAPPPKLLEAAGLTNVFVILRANGLLKLRTFDAVTGNYGDVVACSPSLVNNGVLAQPTPAAFPAPPYSEDPVLSITIDANTGIPYLAVPTTNCALAFFSLSQVPGKPGWPANAFHPDFVTSEEVEELGSPAVDEIDGLVLVRKGGTIFPYHVSTGAKEGSWQLSADAGCTAPLAIALNSVIRCLPSRARLSVLGPENLADPSFAVDRPADVVITPTSIYVLGRDGLFRLDAQMHARAFMPTGAPGGHMALLSDGTLALASRDGNLYLIHVSDR